MFKKRNFCDGITLMELVLVLTMIGVLVFVAYPTHKYNLEAEKAILAKNFLLEVSHKQHSYLLRYGTYATRFDQLGSYPSTALASHYFVVIEVDQNVETANFVLKAEPLLFGQERSLPTFTLNHLGQASDNWFE